MHKKSEDEPIQVTLEREEQIKELVLNHIKDNDRCLESLEPLVRNFIQTKTCRTVTDANDFLRCMIELGLDMCKSKIELVSDDPFVYGPEYQTVYDLRCFARLRGWT